MLQNSIKIFTKYHQDGYEISSILLQDIIKIVTKYPQDCYHQNHQKRWLFLHPCGPSDPLMGFCSPNATHPFKFGLKTRRARKLFVLKTLKKYYVIKCNMHMSDLTTKYLIQICLQKMFSLSPNAPHPFKFGLKTRRARELT